MKILKKIKRWKTFPNLSTLGYYHILGNYIYLDEYKDQDEFDKSSKSPKLDYKRFSTFLYENQHYLDHVSTAWGMNNIFSIYNAYDSVIKHNEYDFHFLRDLNLNLKRDLFNDYYTETYNSKHGSYKDPWMFELTTGLRFDHLGKIDESKPIPFIVFKTKKDERVCRVPLSVASLLETTATNIEYQFIASVIMQLKEPYRTNQLSQLSKQIEKKIYNVDLALYSAAVHLCAARLQISDPIKAYKVASVFAKIALNVPSKYFTSIKLDQEFKDDPVNGKRALAMLVNGERGFMYQLLIRNYLASFGLLNDRELVIDEILSSSNLPNENILLEGIQEEYNSHNDFFLRRANLMDRQVTDKLFFGNNFRRITGIGQQNEPNGIEEFVREYPTLVFSETNIEFEKENLHTIAEKLRKTEVLNNKEWFRLFNYCEDRIDNFDEICGI